MLIKFFSTRQPMGIHFRKKKKVIVAQYQKLWPTYSKQEKNIAHLHV